MPVDITIQGIWQGSPSHGNLRRGTQLSWHDLQLHHSGECEDHNARFCQGVLDECPEDLMKGPSSTLAANHLFNVDAECNRLSNKKASRFHHLTAKLLYLSKCAWPDLQTAVSFLMTQVCGPDKDNYKNLGQCLRYL